MYKFQHRVSKLIESITEEINEETGLDIQASDVEDMVLNEFQVIRNFVDKLDLEDEDTHEGKIQLNFIGTFTINKKAIPYAKNSIEKHKSKSIQKIEK